MSTGSSRPCADRAVGDEFTDVFRLNSTPIWSMELILSIHSLYINQPRNYASVYMNNIFLFSLDTSSNTSKWTVFKSSL